VEVVILAGGMGTRIWPLTMSMPKSLIPVRGIPIVRILVDFFKTNGYRKFVLCIGYKGDSIKQYFESYSHGLDITFVDSGAKADILKRIVDCEHVLSDRFFVCYGDAVADVDLDKLLNFHASRKALVTITTFQMRSPFGLVESDESGRVSEFREKPLLPHWMNIGFIVFERKALKLAKKDLSKKTKWLNFLNEVVSMKRLYTFKHTGLHYTFNTEEERQKMEDDFDVVYKKIVGGAPRGG
jgi:glucose-1-phosphate cytidylyltransferase